MSLTSIRVKQYDNTLILKKGKVSAWQQNMNISNPYYKEIGDIQTLLEYIEKKNGKYVLSEILAFSSTNGYATVEELYSYELDKSVPYCCLVQQQSKPCKLLVTTSKRPIEVVKIGHDRRNISFVPVIVVKEDGIVRGINLN